MQIIFNSEQEAVFYESYIHNYLKVRRQDYAAERWQDVVKSPDVDEWPIQLPAECDDLLFIIPETTNGDQNGNILAIPSNEGGLGRQVSHNTIALTDPNRSESYVAPERYLLE